jgi:hypothetical protein
MACGTVHDVPRSCGIIGDLLCNEVVDCRFAFIEVFMPMKNKVDSIFQQEWLESYLTFDALTNGESVMSSLKCV